MVVRDERTWGNMFTHTQFMFAHVAFGSRNKLYKQKCWKSSLCHQKKNTTTKTPPSSHFCPVPNSFHPGLKFFDYFSHWRRIDDIVTSQDFGSTRQNVYAGGKGLRFFWWRVSFETSKWSSGLRLFSGCSVEQCKQLQNWHFIQLCPKIGDMGTYQKRTTNKMLQGAVWKAKPPANHSKNSPLSWSIVWT